MENGMNGFVVSTACGPVRGEERKCSVLFRGIPFATAERFEKPAPVESFSSFAGDDGILEARGPIWMCYQQGPILTEEENANATSGFYKKEFHSREQMVHLTENILGLNIVMPQEKSEGPLPVLCFIHGGGFENGNSGEDPYGDTEEYAKRGIVLVSLSYRLNVFALYESGNFGLQDLVSGIEWVHKHIASFGGDPNKVTLVGQSAGAMSVTDLLLTKRLRGLIVGAVCMSGGGALPKFVPPLRPSESAEFWAEVREKAGCKSEEEIRRVSPVTLWRAWYEVSRHSKLASLSTQCPGLDGVIIPDLPWNQEKNRLDLDVPLIFGMTSQDFMAPIVYELALRRGLRAEKIGYSPVYTYFFDHALPGNSFKAFHACDLWYMFGNMDRSWRPFADEDRTLAAEMMDYMANFVKTGNPNGEGLREWKPLGRRQKGFLRFDIEEKGYAYPAECRFKAVRTMVWDKGPM